MFAVIRALGFEPRTAAVGVGRSLVAVAQLSVIAFTSDADLFSPVPGRVVEPHCAGLPALSLWCVGGPAALPACRYVAMAVLLVVAIGYRPRWTCVPHWYVTFSLGAAMFAPNGGEHAAKVVTLLLVPLFLGDDRTWQWQAPPKAPAPQWRGAAFAAHLVLRGQVALIYGESAVGKLLDASWRDGTALHYIFQNPYFGTTPAISGFLEGSPLGASVVLVMTWGTLAVELFLAAAPFGGKKVRRVAVVCGAALHCAIGVVLGLVSFGLTMTGLLCLSAGGRSEVVAVAEPELSATTDPAS